MGLVSRLFTDPPDPRLDACLVDDAAHIFEGAIGSHVACIQIALSLLSDGEVFLVIDGNFGPNTAQAVFDFKDERDILGPGQVTPDRIVGKRTIKALDDEMEIFENQSSAGDEIRRIAAPGCRVTFCGDVPQFRSQLLSLGTVDRHMVVADPRFQNPPTATAEILVITMP